MAKQCKSQMLWTEELLLFGQMDWNRSAQGHGLDAHKSTFTMPCFIIHEPQEVRTKWVRRRLTLGDDY